MPVFSFGFDSRAREILHQLGRNVTADETSPEAIKQATDTSELFLFCWEHGLEIFAVSEAQDELSGAFLKWAASRSQIPAHELRKRLFRADGADAVRRFFRRAIGMRDSGEVSTEVLTFREQFSMARERGLTGPYLGKLYQRGLWLAEKTRIELSHHKNAITPASVVTELAEKIFGDLQEHTALIVPNSEECESFAKKLYERNLGQLLFTDSGHGVQGLCDAYHGKMVQKEQLERVAPSVDMLLLFDADIGQQLQAMQIAKIMQQRQNAPLLWVSMFDSASDKSSNESFAGRYNIYAYSKGDLEDIVSANLKEHQKVETAVNRLIEHEVSGFLEWVGTNEHYRFGNIIGKSEAMQKILDMVARIAQSDISVLIDGESGTGKELIAKAIHEHSKRVNNPFMVVNCGAIPETLLESELFGHVKGAFTGAYSNKKGLIQAANHGTIFLDEIGETSQATQVKLLRFLQEGEIKPVGSNDTLHLDVRVITATNRDLEEMVNAGEFRQDLYYRLNVIQITLPPLRERREDILPLAEFFIKKYSKQMHKTVYGLEDDARKLLLEYDWHGNVRELENAIERAVALSSGQLLTVTDLPPNLSNHRPMRVDGASYSGDLSLKELEKRHITSMLKQHNWNYDLVTQLLGIGRTTLWRKMKEYDISN